jgi:predicted GNAT family N-acyltransferase
MERVVRRAEGVAERAEALRVRRAVFIQEQGVDPALEHDEHDEGSEFLVALAGNRMVGTARFRRTERGVKLERVAVLAESRGSGIGSALVRHAIALRPGDAELYIHAQQSAVGFWERMGFVAEGPAFREADIVHRFMRLRVEPAP